MEDATSAAPAEFCRDSEMLEQPWENLQAYLAERGLDFKSASVRQFAHGYGNLKYLIEVDAEPRVLRRPPPGPLPPGGNDMGREYGVLSGLWRRFPLAPRAQLFCDDESVLGAPFFLMEYRPGLVVRSELPENLRGREVELTEMLVETLATLHAVAPAEVGLHELGRPEGFLSRTVEGWAKRAEVASGGTPLASVGELADWLRDHSVPDADPVLLHNDYKLNNIILDADHPTRPIAVIDWDMATRGDALFDLATLLSYWSEADDPPAMYALEQMPTASPGFPCRQEVAELYAERSGLDLSDFIFHRVLAMFKLGVVFLQLHARYRRGSTCDERFAEFGKVAEGLLDFALEASAGRVF